MPGKSKYSFGLEGKRFGRWTVLTFSHRRRESRKSFAYLWHCRCDCGEQRAISARMLFRGKSISCGCYKIEFNISQVRKHGALDGKAKGVRRPDEYNIWLHMKDRCNNPNNNHYRFYGGRGIAVCSRWATDFAAFYIDMGPRPTKIHSIDRFPDMNGNYEPSNCRWATPKEQGNNTRRNIKNRLHSSTL